MPLNSDQCTAVRLPRRFCMPPHWAFYFISLVLVALLSGCGTSSVTQAGVISITYPSGVTAGQLPVLSSALVSMMPLNDSANLGVDWTLTCGGNAQVGYVTSGCGTLVPAHTANGSAATYTAPGIIPTSGAITIVARVSSDPSQQASATMTIINPLISVALSTAPASLAVGAKTTISAMLTNDVNSLGARWAANCGSSDCGSFNPQQTLSGVTTTYTAPATVPLGGSVTFTATAIGDTTNAAKATSPSIAIEPLTVSVSPATFSIATSTTANIVATVTNDVKNAGVTWDCGFNGCGSFNPTKTASGSPTAYTAPSIVPAAGAVKITATSANNGLTASAMATVTQAPVIVVTMTRSVPATLGEGKSTTLGAAVSGDGTNAGVDWTASCGSTVPGACGSFNPASTSSGSTTIYTAPASLPPSNPVTITATSHAYNLNPSLIANAASGSTTITAAAAIALNQQPPASLTTNAQAVVSATVTNDASPGGISWSVSCSSTLAGACGYVQPYQTANGVEATYIAPPIDPGTPVQIVAMSTAFPALTTQSIPVTIVPSKNHSISFVPFLPSQLALGASVTLNAAVSNDTSHSGVDWSVCATDCGFFTIKPAIAAMAAVPPSAGDPGSPYVPAVPAVTATSVQGWPNSLPITYTAPTVVPGSGDVVVTATATADRLNNIATPATAVAAMALTSASTGPELHGAVHAGTQPVAGASVYLYAAGTSGYGSASTLVYNPSSTAFATTDSSGNFTIPSGYTCPASTSQVYLVALGGQASASGANQNLGLMTALGACGALSSSPLMINEITTVASAAALATFSADNVQTGQMSYLYIGSSSANATVGLANAFASVNNLVNITTGQPRFWTLAENAAVPYVQINTLADALNACAITTGGSSGDSTACGNLFSYANPLGMLYPGFAPTDTLQAVFDLMKPPSPKVSNLLHPASVFTLATKSSPFQPILNKAPNNWSIALNYTFGGGIGGTGTAASGSSALAVDASGNLWIANKNIHSVSEWNGFGAAYSPNTSGTVAGGFTAGGIYAPSALAIDQSGYVWVANGNSTLTRLDPTGSADANSPFSGGGLAAGSSIAIDGANNVWIANSGSPGSLSRFNQRGIALSPAAGYTDSIANPSVIAMDGKSNVWVYNQKPVSVITNYVELTNTSGSLMTGISGGYVAYNGSPSQLAIDASGNLWTVANAAYGIVKIPANYLGGAQVSSYDDVSLSIAGPQGMAFDGSNRLWLADTQSNANYATPSLLLVDTTLSTPSRAIDYPDADLAAGAASVAIDNAGNVWILLNNNSVKEYVGVATPVVTPLSVGVKSNKLGAKP